MIMSMTGYGRGESLLYERKFLIEIKSVNHRYNDIYIKLPKIMNLFEDKIKKEILNAISRGKTEVYITYQSFSKKDIKISFNENLSDAYIDVINKVSEKYHLKKDDVLSSLLKFEDVITIDNNYLDKNLEDEYFKSLSAALKEAIDNFIKMRISEGQMLEEDLRAKLSQLQIIITNINNIYPEALIESQNKLKTRITDALKDISIDENRLLQELSILADKYCIDEEITRFYSHLEQFDDILNNGGIVGRKLDFLLQEMNREANTIGSKSNNINITKLVVELKSVIEKVREQVQNIE